MDRQPKSILITDCGTSMTTAVLIELVDGGYRLVARGEAPTTIELPFEDVTVGISSAVRNIEESRGRRILNHMSEGIISPEDEKGNGVDLYLSTSSTGGGLQMMVAGLVRIMTAESAERAALGAGAMVMDVIAIDDGRFPHAKIQRIRELRPDMILLSGGIDGGNYEYVLELAEHIRDAKLKPGLPVIYAGNVSARERVAEILEGKARLFFVDNVRPVLEEEVLEPAGLEIHRRFMEHVVTHAPGYQKLAGWTHGPIIPTTGAVGDLVEGIAKHFNESVLAVNIGDATTDVFSVFEKRFTRTVSGDLGLGSSASNALVEAGLKKVTRWLPFDFPEEEVRNLLRNKTLRPNTLPATLADLMLEHALAREILRLSLDQHKGSVVALRGVRRIRDVSETFKQTGSGETLVNPMALRTIIGSGPIFQQAPRPIQAMMILLDAFQPEGVTQLAMDQHFSAPHAGILSAYHPDIAFSVFQKDSLVSLGDVIAPVGAARPGQPCVNVRFSDEDGSVMSQEFPFGTLRAIAVPRGNVQAEITPAAGFDVGKGKGKSLSMKLVSGLCGVVVDARGRNPLVLPEEDAVRKKLIESWYKALNAYPLEKGV
jgi:uncharacterized protein (TIGR01319 family)